MAYTQTPFGFAVPKVDYVAPVVAQLPIWRGARRVSVDVETCDPHLTKAPGHTRGMGLGLYRGDGYAVGYSVAIEDGPDFYLPIRHQGGDNLDAGHVHAYLRDQLNTFDGEIVGANLNYDLPWLRNFGARFQCVKRFRDVQLADPLIYEHHLQYSLDAIALRRGFAGKDEGVLKGYADAYGVKAKSDLWRLPGRAADAYARRDTRLPLAILEDQEKDIARLEIQRVWDLESDVLPAVVEMRELGVPIDLDKLDLIERMCMDRERTEMAQVRRLTGVQVAIDDVYNARVLARCLEQSGLKVPMTEGTEKRAPQVSVTNEWLDTIGPVGQAMQVARKYNKLRTTFVKQVRDFNVNGRVHCTFHQLRTTKENEGSSDDEKGARYGRFSSESFNIQNQPARHPEFGKLWRSIYVAEPGAEWGCSDWSQQEPRFAVHYAELLDCPGAREAGDAYRTDPTVDCHGRTAKLCGIIRDIAKNLFNGRVYGMGDAKMCKMYLKLPTQWVERRGVMREVAGDEAQVIIDRFNQGAPWVKSLSRAASNRANLVGHVWTICRRRCNFPKDEVTGQYMWTHAAFNRVGQGSAADQMKLALVEARRAGIPVNMVVHDEFDTAGASRAQLRQLRQIQLDVVKLSVPQVVDLELGPNWGELTKIEQFEAAAA